VHLKEPSPISLFIGVVIALLSLISVSLPVLAGVSEVSTSNPLSTNTPNAYIIRSNTAIPQTPTSSPTAYITQIGVVSDTQTTQPINTSTPTSLPLPAQLQYFAQFIYFPNIFNQIFIPTATPTPTQTSTPTPTQSPPETALFCDDLVQPVSIPDNYANGVNDDISIADGRVLVSLSLYLDISHTWVGDLVIRLTNQNTGQSITVLDRPGEPPNYCSYNDIVTILEDAAAQPVDDQCAYYPHAISGIYLPSEPLVFFTGESIAATWRLNISDNYPNDVGELNHWCLKAELADSMPAPTPTPTPISLPSSANVSGMSGQDQQLTLDCESRSAVDWARHFGSNIGEIDFLNQLPNSDDPEVGFVGDPDGVWGNMPPDDYGVHAPPIAALLRHYGPTANSFRQLSWDDLRAEITSGNPVIAWIIGGSNYNLINGTPHIYTAASTSNTTIVAPWEHTVIMVGYSPTDVTILNGSHFLTIPVDQFLDSWSVLDFMAVLARP